MVEEGETELEWVRERLAGVRLSYGELERLSLDLRRSLEDAEKGNRDLLLTEKNLETTQTNLQRVNTLLATSEENLRLTVVSFREAESRLVAREADLERTRESLELSEKDLEMRTEDLVTTEGNLERVLSVLRAMGPVRGEQVTSHDIRPVSNIPHVATCRIERRGMIHAEDMTQFMR